MANLLIIGTWTKWLILSGREKCYSVSAIDRLTFVVCILQKESQHLFVNSFTIQLVFMKMHFNQKFHVFHSKIPNKVETALNFVINRSKIDKHQCAEQCQAYLLVFGGSFIQLFLSLCTTVHSIHSLIWWKFRVFHTFRIFNGQQSHNKSIDVKCNQE